MALVANLVMIVLELMGLYQVRSRMNWRILAFYTQLSNLIAFAASVCFVCLGPERALLLRYLGTCMLIMTFCVSAFVLIPMGGSAKKLLFSGNGLFHHTLCPLVSAVSYAFLEAHVHKAQAIILPCAVTLAYGLVMIGLNALRIVDGPYPFFRVHQQKPLATIMWMSALMLLAGLISWGVFCI